MGSPRAPHLPDPEHEHDPDLARDRYRVLVLGAKHVRPTAPKKCVIGDRGMIRLAQDADAAAIADIHVAAWHGAYRGLVPDAVLDEFTLEVRLPRWRQILGVPGDGRTTVYERDGRVVSFATVGASRDQPGDGEIWALYVHPTFWGCGAGRALVADGLDALQARGFGQAILWVLEGNARAIRFYERAGFRLDGASKLENEVAHLRMLRSLAATTSSKP